MLNGKISYFEPEKFRFLIQANFLIIVSKIRVVLMLFKEKFIYRFSTLSITSNLVVIIILIKDLISNDIKNTYQIKNYHLLELCKYVANAL